MKPKVTIINTETEFALEYETDKGIQKHSLQNANYSIPLIWRSQGRTWMWLTSYFSDGTTPTEQVVELIY